MKQVYKLWEIENNQQFWNLSDYILKLELDIVRYCQRLLFNKRKLKFFKFYLNNSSSFDSL